MLKYAKERKIGEGAFGKAWLVHKKDDLNSRYVIKEVNISKMSRREKDDARNEITVLAQMKHPNIVSYQGSFEEVGKLFIIMDYCDGGDLHTKISSRKNQLFEEELIINWFVQLCLGIKHIHDRKILHRDVKTQNIFLNRQGTIVKVGDFGISKVMNSTVELARTCIGTPYYLSPEICEGRPYNHKSDVWSLGCVLYELVSLKHAFEAGNMNNLVLKIIKGSYPALPAKYSKDLRNLVGLLLKRQPKDRPSVNETLKMPIMKERIQKFLSETLIHDEFSHTVLHRKKPGMKVIGEIAPSKSEPSANEFQFKVPSRFAKPKEPEAKFVKPKERIYKPDAIYGAPIVPKQKFPVNKPKMFAPPPPNAAQLNAAKKRRLELEAQENKRKALLQVKKDNLEKKVKERVMPDNILQRQQQNVKMKAREVGWRQPLKDAFDPTIEKDKISPSVAVKVAPNEGKFAHKNEILYVAKQAQQFGAEAANRAQVVQEFIARRQEAAKIKARHENIFGTPASKNSPKRDIQPNQAVQRPFSKDKVEEEYLARLEAIRMQNFEERKRKINQVNIEPPKIENPCKKFPELEKPIEKNEPLIARVKKEVESKPPILPENPKQKPDIRNKWGPPSKPTIPSKFEFTGSQMEATNAVPNEVFIAEKGIEGNALSPESNRGKWAQPTNTIVNRLEALDLAQTQLPELKIEDVTVIVEDDPEDSATTAKNTDTVEDNEEKSTKSPCNMSKTYICERKRELTMIQEETPTITVEIELEDSTFVQDESDEKSETMTAKEDVVEETKMDDSKIATSSNKDLEFKDETFKTKLAAKFDDPEQQDVNIQDLNDGELEEKDIENTQGASTPQKENCSQHEQMKTEELLTELINSLVNEIIQNATTQLFQELPSESQQESEEQLTFVINDNVSDEEAALSSIALESIGQGTLWDTHPSIDPTDSNPDFQTTTEDVQQIIKAMETAGEGDECFQEYSKFLEAMSDNSDLEYDGDELNDGPNTNPIEMALGRLESTSLPDLSPLFIHTNTKFPQSVSNTELELGLVDIEDGDGEDSNDEYHSMIETMRCLLADSEPDLKKVMLDVSDSESDSSDDEMNSLSIYGILEKSRIELEKKIEPAKLMDAYNLLHASCSLESLTSEEGLKTQTQLISTITGSKDDVNDALLQLTIADLTYFTSDSQEFACTS